MHNVIAMKNIIICLILNSESEYDSDYDSSDIEYDEFDDKYEELLDSYFYE